MSGARREVLGAQPPHYSIEVDGVVLRYNDDGDGPVLLCLHAIGHGAADYHAVSKAMRGHYRVIALDWPGHGRSGDDREAASPWRYASLLEKFIDQLQLPRIVLIGNSIGGGAALRYAAAHLQNVRGLVLCNPQGLDAQDRIGPLFSKAMARFFAAGAAGAGWFPRAFDFYYRQVLPAPAAADARACIVAAAQESAPILALAWQSFADPHADARALIPQIRCPVQFCWAMRDRFIAWPRNRAAILRFANARVEKFESSGHSPFLEQPEHFMHVLERFLDGLR